MRERIGAISVVVVAAIVTLSMVHSSRRSVAPVAPQQTSIIDPVITLPGSLEVTRVSSVESTQAQSREYEDWRGPGSFVGKVIDETGSVIPRVAIAAVLSSDRVVLRPLTRTTSDENGGFRLDGATAMLALVLEKPGLPTVRRNVVAEDLVVENQPITITMQSTKTAALVVRASGPVRTDADELTIVVKPRRLDMTTVRAFAELGFKPAPEVRERVDRPEIVVQVPAGVDLFVDCTIRGASVAHVDVDALHAGEQRAITLDTSASSFARLRFVDADTLEQIEWDSETQYFSELVVALVPAGEATGKPVELVRRSATSTFSTPIAVPHPGLLVIDVSARGYAPAHVERTIGGSEEAVLIELRRFIPVRVHLVDDLGQDLLVAIGDWFEIDRPGRFVSGGYRCFAPRLTLRAFPSGSTIPKVQSQADCFNDHNRSLWHRKYTAGSMDFSWAEILVPAEGAVVAAYVDDAVVGSTAVQASLTDFEMVVQFPKAATGRLRFRVLDRETLAPPTAFDFRLEKRSERGDVVEAIQFAVDSTDDGRVEMPRIMRGAYRVAIVDPMTWSEAAWFDIDVIEGSTTDAGDVLAGSVASLNIAVIDDVGRPVASARIRLFHEEMWSFVRLVPQSVRPSEWAYANTNGQAELICRIGTIRAEAHSPGFAPSAVDVDVQGRGSDGCVIVLHRSIPAIVSAQVAEDCQRALGTGALLVTDAQSRCEYYRGAISAALQIDVAEGTECEIRCVDSDSQAVVHAIERKGRLERLD